MATRDVVSCALVTPESFQLSPTRVLFFGQHNMNCTSLSDTAREAVRLSLLSAVCIVQELCSTSGA